MTRYTRPEPGVDPSLSTCRSCGDPIRWYANGETGRRIPANPDPDPDGTIDLRPITGKGVQAFVLKGDDLRRARARGRELLVSHFATCPQADQWRSSR